MPCFYAVKSYLGLNNFAEIRLTVITFKISSIAEDLEKNQYTNFSPGEGEENVPKRSVSNSSKSRGENVTSTRNQLSRLKYFFQRRGFFIISKDGDLPLLRGDVE